MGEDAARLRLSDGRELRGTLLAARWNRFPLRGLLGIDTAGHAYRPGCLGGARANRASPRQHGLATVLESRTLFALSAAERWALFHQRVEGPRSSETLEPAARREALTAASGAACRWGPLTTQLASFPLKLQYAVDYVRPRAVLLGAWCTRSPAKDETRLAGLAALAQVLGRGRSASGLRRLSAAAPL